MKIVVRAGFFAALLLPACAGGGDAGEGEKPPTWEERWAAIYAPGDEADRGCHDEMLALGKTVKKGEREGIYRRLVGGLEKLAAARREAEALILEARKDTEILDATVAWEEVVTGWLGTELQVRKLIPVEILEAEAREAESRRE
jgi:hypothetical protein